MPKRAEPIEVGKWTSRINVARKFREADGRKMAWSNMKKFYRNLFDANTVAVNLLFSHGRQLVPFLYFKNPVVECTAIWEGWEKKAKIQEAVDNMLIKKMRVKEQLKLIIQDTYLYDYGIRKIGYDSEFGYDPTGSIWAELLKELGINVTKEELTEYNTYIVREFPFFLRVPPSRFCVDPDVNGPGLETARWVAEEFYRPWEDVINDDRYKVPKNLIPSHVVNYDETVMSPNKVGREALGKDQRDYARVKLFEIWNKEKLEVYTIAENCDQFLREQEDVWELANFFPYDKLSFNPVSDEHYSTSDAMYIERLQVELNDTRTQETKHRKKENLKVVAKRNTLRPEEKDKLNSGEVGSLVEIDGNPNTDIAFPTPNMSRDIYNVGDIIRNDFKELLALGPNQLGQEMGRRKTAAEAMIINQYSQLRSDERRDIIADFLEKSVVDINRLVYKFWDNEDVIQVIGPEGVMWEPWSGESLAGEYAIRVVPNSTLPMTKELLQRKTSEILLKYRNDPYIDQRELRRLDLDAYEEFDTNRLLLAQPNQAQVMMDFRPGQPRHGAEEGSRINIPESPETIEASQTMGEMAGASVEEGQ